jgi:hypothetical protein
MSERVSWVAPLACERSSPRRSTATDRHSPSHVGAMVLALMGIVAGMQPAFSQAPRAPMTAPPAQESPRSFPPDTTPYVRPAIPEDTLRTPLQSPRGPDTSFPAPKDPNGAARPSDRRKGD